MLGINPFDIHSHGRSPFTRAPYRRTQPPAPTPPSPTISISADQKTYIVKVKAPGGHSLHGLRATEDANTLRIDGCLIRTDGSMAADRWLLHEYIPSRRIPVFEDGSSKSTCIGVVEAGSVLRGHIPSSRGWIALEGDDGGFIYDDGSLVHRALEQGKVPFVKVVELPHDALRRGAVVSGPSRFRVRFSPRVAIRGGPGTEHNIIGTFSEGEVFSGSRSEDSNWVAVGEGGNHGKGGWVMVKHPRHGTLLEPVDATQMTVNVPRRSPQPPRPTHQPAIAPAPRSATTTAPQQPPKAANTSAQVPPRSAPKPDAPATRRTARVVSGGYRHGVPRHGEPILSEVPSSPEHVQRPEEQCECFVATPAGGFAPTACEPQ